MNWKLEATERLRMYDAMRQAMVNLPEEIRQLEQEAYTLRGKNIEKPPGRVRGCRQEDLLLSNMVHRQELEAALKRTGAWLQVTDRALAALTPEEKLILHRLYVYPERGSLDRLCTDLEVEQSSIYRKRDKALRKFTCALYGFSNEK